MFFNNKVTLTVKNLFDEWLEHIAITAKRSTVNTYRIIAENHILPLMSDMPLYKVSSSFLSDIVKNKLNNGRLDGKGGLSAKTVQNIVCVLKAVFSFAEKVHNMRSPADVVPFPKCERKDIEVLTDEEVSTIREYCESKEDYFSVMYELCLATGIRIGELCALKGNDIDYVNNLFLEEFESFCRISNLIINGTNIIKYSDDLLSPIQVSFTLNRNNPKEIYAVEDYAKAADRMMKFSGVDAAFTLGYVDDENIHISARSGKKVNVGHIMQAMEGQCGGNGQSAGGRITSDDIFKVEQDLMDRVGLGLSDEEDIIEEPPVIKSKQIRKIKKS